MTIMNLNIRNNTQEDTEACLETFLHEMHVRTNKNLDAYTSKHDEVSASLHMFWTLLLIVHKKRS